MKTLLQITIVAGATLCAQAQASALDYFLKIDGIKGESHSDKHKDWIDIDSFSWGVTNSGGGGVGGGGGSGKAVAMPYGWTQSVDMSTPYVFMAVASGKHFKTVEMNTIRAGEGSPPSFFTMVFDDVTFSSLQLSGGSESLRAAGEAVYSKVTMKYRPQDSKGGYGPEIIGSWDFSKGGEFSGDPEVLMGLFLAQPTSIGPIPSVPEPRTWALMGLGLVAVALARRRSAQAA